jgi:hypothetical protein
LVFIDFTLLNQILWQGLDGLKGPVLSGTGFYIKRNSLYGDSMQKGNND